MSAGHRHDSKDDPEKPLEPKLAALLPDSRRAEVDKALETIRVVRGVYDVPYLAGYSADGKTIYIDKRLPARLEIRTRGNDGRRWVDVVPFLLRHEVTEKTIMDETGASYLPAHHVATREERNAVTRAGIDWADYEDTLDGFIRTTEHEQLHKVPPDLDLKPYRELGDTKHLRELQNRQWAGEPKHG